MQRVAFLGLVAAGLCAGCLGGLAPLESPVPAPHVEPGAWWTVRQREWRGAEDPWRDVHETAWVVGHREVDGAAWPVAVVREGAAPPPFPPGPFRLVLLPPGRPVADGGAAPAAEGHAPPAADCRGAEACPTEALLPSRSGLPLRPLPFPLAGDYRLALGDGAGSSVTVAGRVAGTGEASYPFGRAEMVRLEERHRFRGFEHGGHADAALDYVPSLGLVAREVERSCDLPSPLGCGATGGRRLDVLEHGWLQPPSLAEVGRWFAEAQAHLVFPARVATEGHPANVAAGDRVWLNATFHGLRPGDTLETRWWPMGRPEQTTVVPGGHTSYAPGVPGWHEARVVVLAPQGVPIASTPAEFRARYEASIPVACAEACPAVRVPLGPRVTHVSVAVAADGLPRDGHLELRDGDGARRAACRCQALEAPVWGAQGAHWSAHWLPGVELPGTRATLRILVE